MFKEKRIDAYEERKDCSEENEFVCEVIADRIEENEK